MVVTTGEKVLFQLKESTEKKYMEEDYYVEQESCKRLLVQAYYLCQAQNVGYGAINAERIKRLCELFYPGEITLV